jgi:AcrR family transcriptional regulator
MILGQATGLFQRQGYHATTMDHIAAAAGLNKATVYHYYKSKSDLLFDVYSSGIDAILTRFATHSEDETPSHTISRIIGDIIAAMAEDQSRTAVYYQERPFIEAIFAPEAYADLRVKESSYAHHVQDVVERGITSGEFHDVDTRIAAHTLLAAAGQTYQWYRPQGQTTVDDVAAAMSTIFLRGLSR